MSAKEGTRKIKPIVIRNGINGIVAHNVFHLNKKVNDKWRMEWCVSGLNPQAVSSTPTHIALDTLTHWSERNLLHVEYFKSNQLSRCTIDKGIFENSIHRYQLFVFVLLMRIILCAAPCRYYYQNDISTSVFSILWAFISVLRHAMNDLQF